MALMVPTKDHFPAQYSVCGELEDAVAIVRSKLSVENMVNFRKMPFGHFMDVRKLQFSGQLIHILMLHLVREQPEDEMWFMINGTINKFSFEDFCQITSLPNSKSYPNFSNVKASSQTIPKKYLGGGTVKCTFAHLRNMFMTAEEDEPGSDLHKLASLYFVEHVLLAKDRGTCIDASHLEVVDDTDVFIAYPWAWESYLLTVRHLKGMMDGQPEKFQEKKNNNSNLKSWKYALYGFPLVLQILAYETFPVLEDEVAKCNREIKCPLLRWGAKKCPQYHSLKQLLFPNEPEEVANKMENTLDLLFRSVEDLKNTPNKRIDALEDKIDGLCCDVNDVFTIVGRKR
ncbi:unnamed protein product [Cuscuta campestris]|uniref:DUF1985 domain-containing protein n=1 Tax=Cuscuta campestris TaxID=132261 RepID=A0A484L6S8_9ASTE|nr:unnamed protein product [Cuscuta campestris]